MNTIILTSYLDFYEKDEQGNKIAHNFGNDNGILDCLKSNIKKYDNFVFVANGMEGEKAEFQFGKGVCVMAERNSNKRKWTAEEVQQWYRDTGAFTYANPDDLNIIVKKPRREGLTVNWANPKAYLLQGAILAVVFAIIYLLQ